MDASVRTVGECSDMSHEAKVLVIILKGATKHNNDNIKQLQEIFSSSYFHTIVLDVGKPPIIPINLSITQAQYIDNYRMLKVLNYSRYHYGSMPCLVVRDNSVSNLSPSDMANKVNDSLRAQSDMVFLCVWNDLCNKYADVNEAKNQMGSSVVWTVQPTATQAVLYSTTAREYIIEQLNTTNNTISGVINIAVGSGALLAVAFVPNILDYDINLATQNSDFSKLNQCSTASTNNTPVSGTATLLWFVIIVFLVLLLAYALIVVGPHTPVVVV
jgi:hypothetical protein